jgi:hypothetical protein
MPHDEYVAWWSYFVEWTAVDKVRKAQEEHDKDMDSVARALKPR